MQWNRLRSFEEWNKNPYANTYALSRGTHPVNPEVSEGLWLYTSLKILFAYLLVV